MTYRIVAPIHRKATASPSLHFHELCQHWCDGCRRSAIASTTDCRNCRTAKRNEDGRAVFLASQSKPGAGSLSPAPALGGPTEPETVTDPEGSFAPLVRPTPKRTRA